MSCINRSLRIASYHFRHITATVRIPVVLIMIALFIMENLRAVTLFSDAVGIPATPYAFPHLTNDYVCQLIMMAGAILLFCDAPFEEKEYPYMLPRAGRLAWSAGQVIYIIGLALLYVLFIFFFSVLPLAGHLEFASEWGKIWGTLAKTDAGVEFGVMLRVTEYMVSHYTALPALFISLALEWACVTWLGLLIYFLNKLTDRPIGTFAGAFCVLLDICIANDWVNWANKFSPITLAQINTYAGYNLRYNITFGYGKVFFVVGILVLVLLCIFANYKDKVWLLVSGYNKKRRAKQRGYKEVNHG